MVNSSALVSAIQSDIIKAKDDLKETHETLKRRTGRDYNQPPQKRNTYESYDRAKEDNKKFDDRGNRGKRTPSGIFARLGAPILDGPQKTDRKRSSETQFRRRAPSESEEKNDFQRNQKPSISSSVARPPPDGKSRSEAAAAQTKDRASRDRNRRMFGALLGTLERFKNDEAKQKDKEEQRAAIERKLEEKGKAEKEEMRKETIELINQRKEQQALIKKLHFKMMRVKEHDIWEKHQKQLKKFIRTKASPQIFWLPKASTKESKQLIRDTANLIDQEIEDKRIMLNSELDSVLKNRKDDGEKENTIDEESETVSSKKPKIQIQISRSDLEDEPDLDYNNCEDILDFEVDEPKKHDTDADSTLPSRVIVQVGRDVNGVSNSFRKVAVISSDAHKEDNIDDKESDHSETNNSQMPDKAGDNLPAENVLEPSFNKETPENNLDPAKSGDEEAQSNIDNNNSVLNSFNQNASQEQEKDSEKSPSSPLTVTVKNEPHDSRQIISAEAASACRINVDLSIVKTEPEDKPSKDRQSDTTENPSKDKRQREENEVNSEEEKRRKLKERFDSIANETRNQAEARKKLEASKNKESIEDPDSRTDKGAKRKSRKDSESDKSSKNKSKKDSESSNASDDSDSSSSGSDKGSSSSSGSESSDDSKSSESSSSTSSTGSETEKRRDRIKKKKIDSRKRVEDKRKALRSSSSESESNSRNKRKKNWNSRTNDRKRRRSKSPESHRSRPNHSKRSRK